MSEKRNTYDREFREGAVRIVEETGVAAHCDKQSLYLLATQICCGLVEHQQPLWKVGDSTQRMRGERPNSQGALWKRQK